VLVFDLLLKNAGGEFSQPKRAELARKSTLMTVTPLFEKIPGQIGLDSLGVDSLKEGQIRDGRQHKAHPGWNYTLEPRA
jgi:hypothetical protein